MTAPSSLPRVVALTVCLLLPPRVGAQSSQPFSAQVAGLYTVVAFGSGSNVGGVGVEAQLRYTPGRISLGAGYQLSWHETGGDDMRLRGLFVEPRYAVDVGSDRWAPYLAGRIVWLQSTNRWATLPKFDVAGIGYGGGAGVIVFLASHINFDVGAAYQRQTLHDKVFPSNPPVRFEPLDGYVAKAGVTIGFGER